MKVLLVKPRYFDRAYRSYFTGCFPPLGLTYLASVLLKNGFDVSILDMEALRLSETDFRRHLKNNNPDVVGIDIRTPLLYKAARLASIARKHSKDVKVIIGGPHLFVLPQNALEIVKDADFGLRGESEFTLLKLIGALSLNRDINDLKNIEGICFRYDGNKFFISPQVPLIQELDCLPMPAHELLPLGKYFDNLVEGKRYYSMMTARGCSYRCTFCAESLLYGRKVRAISIENILNEIELLTKRYKIDYISFVDATFNYDRERVISICKEIIKRNLKFSWRAKARVDLVDCEMLSVMKRAGCKLISYGVESASSETLRYFKKDYDIEDVYAAFELTRKVGIETFGYFLLGSPTESKQDCIETIKLSRKLKPLFAQFAFPLPLAKTELWQELRTGSVIDPGLDNHYFHFLCFKHPHIKENVLKQIYFMANIKFYFNFPYLLRQLKNTHSLTHLFKKIKIAVFVIYYILKDIYNYAKVTKINLSFK